MARLRVLAARLLAAAVPSAPAPIAARASLTPVPGSRWEARPGAGHPDLLLNWRPASANRLELSDAYLAGLVADWQGSAR